MRNVLVPALLLCACSWVAGCSNSNDDFFGPSSGYAFCEQDSDCKSGDVCARSSECFPAEQVRHIAVLWTIGGQPASATTCAGHESFTLQFQADNGYGFGYAPVPCSAGKFTVDKMPTIIDFVEMFEQTALDASGGIADSSGNAVLDLTVT